MRSCIREFWLIGIKGNLKEGLRRTHFSEMINARRYMNDVIGIFVGRMEPTRLLCEEKFVIYKNSQ